MDDAKTRKHPFDFLLLPEAVWLDERISYGAKHLLAILLRYSDKGFYKEASYRWLGEKMGVGNRETRRRMQELTNNEFVTKVPRERRVNGYQINVGIYVGRGTEQPMGQMTPGSERPSPLGHNDPPYTREIVQEKILPHSPKVSEEVSSRLRRNVSSEGDEREIDIETGLEILPSPKPNASKAMRELVRWSEERRGGRFVNYPKQFRALAKIRAARIWPDEAKARWLELEEDRFWKDRLDWMTVASSFDKKR